MAQREREIDTIIRERGSPGVCNTVAEVKSLKVKKKMGKCMMSQHRAVVLLLH